MIRQHLVFDELCDAAQARGMYVALTAVDRELHKVVVARGGRGKQKERIVERVLLPGKSLNEAAAGCLGFLRGIVP